MSTERRRQPPLALARVRPLVDLGEAFLDQRMDEHKQHLVVLNESPSTAETLSRCKVRVSSQALRQTAGDRLVPVVQLAEELQSRAERASR